MKNFGIYLGILFGIMFLFPWGVVHYMGDAGLPMCFAMFYMLNPMLAACVGVYSGINIKAAWFYPILLAVAFLGGVWYAFNTTEIMFIVYSITYIIIGYFAMLATFVIRKILKK